VQKVKFKYKLWLDKDGKVFGDGPLDLLRRIERTGSLRSAAAEINMSYSQAWNLFKSLEKRLGFKLLTKKIGGESGGGSELTREAKLLMKRYENFRERADKALNAIFEDVFG
jgi:molybdate transport system regulatory protein